MDPQTGKIYRFDESDVEQRVAELEAALGRNLLRLTPEQAENLQRLSAAKRIAWAKHRLARGPEETDDEYRAVKNAQKRERRKRRGK